MLAGAIALSPGALAQERAAPTADPVLNLLVNVARVFDQMGIPLDWDDDRLLSLLYESNELDDPETSLAFRTSRGHALPFYVLDPPGRARCEPGAEEPRSTVLFVGGIHPNEVSPLYSSWRELMSLLAGGGSPYANTRIVYVPLANPDGLIDSHDRGGAPTRESAAGVDLNRDFRSPSAQPETRFLAELIRVYHPTHIVSLHGPFGWLDYDGPPPSQAGRSWMRRVHSRAPGLGIASGFRTYPGSLGEYAGERLGIPVLTFEYPSKSAGTAVRDWLHYGDALSESLRVSED